MAAVTITPPVAAVTVTAPLPLQRYTPTPDDVAPHLRARLRDSNGRQVSTWSTETIPTETQVQGLITAAVSVVDMKVGEDIPYRLWTVAKRAAALRTAADIERSYFPEQATEKQNSAYDKFEKEYKELIAEIVEAVVEPQPGEMAIRSIGMRSPMSPGNSSYDYYDEIAQGNY